MTGILVLLALIDFWGGVVLCVLSGIGIISVPIWQICVICAVILAVLIILIHLASLREYGDICNDEDNFDRDKQELFEALSRAEKLEQSTKN